MLEPKKLVRLLAILITFATFLSNEAKTQWTICPSAGVEFALPRYKGNNTHLTPGYFSKIQNNPQISFHLALDIQKEILQNWSIYCNLSALKYKFTIVSGTIFWGDEKEATGQFQNIRTCLGARYAFSENFQIGLGVSLDYSSNFRFHNEDGERLDTERAYNITRDLGINLNAIRKFGKINVTLQINKGLIPIVSSERKPVLDERREIEPLSAIILTLGYRIEL